MNYSYAQYIAERNANYRTFARDHSYGEWAWMKRWQAGEIDNSVGARCRCCGRCCCR